MSYENENENESSNKKSVGKPEHHKCDINEFIFDESFSPGSDFFHYVNNRWIQENTIPDDYTRWGGFEILHEDNLKRLNSLITDYKSCDDNTKTQDPFENLVTLYNKGIDEDSLQKQGIKSANMYIRNIFTINNKKDLFYLLGDFTMKGITGFFSVDVDVDAKNSNNNVIYVSQSGLGLPDRDYYFLDTKQKERNEYKRYVNRIFDHFNMSDVDEITNKIYEIEYKLADASQTRTERRDPHLTYNEYTFKQLCEEFPNIDWVRYINKTTLFDRCEWTPINQTKFVIDNPGFLKCVNDIVDKYSLVELQWYLMNRTINSIGNFLDNKSYEIIFDFYGRLLLGQKEPKPRWKRVMSTVQHLLGELLGRRYVETYFPEESKKKCLDMVNDLKNSLEQKIINVEWMTSETKEKALLKLHKFGVKIGYPDKWRDYSALVCDKNQTYIDCVLSCRKFQIEWEFAQLDLPVDRTKWEMNPQEINAYYHPVMNEIVFPAGILQAPFFDPEQDNAYNYGAIGAIIGHEMTHGFDDQGRKFDHEGNMVNWWTDKDAEEYSKRTDIIRDQYAAYVVEGENVNGELTLGENIADIGGLLIAYHALSERENFKETHGDNSTEDTRKKKLEKQKKFFLGWSRAWRTHTRRETQLQRLLTDPHSPAVCRVNGVVKNIPAFYDAFQVKSEDPLYLSPENRARIW